MTNLPLWLRKPCPWYCHHLVRCVYPWQCGTIRDVHTLPVIILQFSWNSGSQWNMLCPCSLWLFMKMSVFLILQTTNEKKVFIWCVENNGNSLSSHNGTAGEKSHVFSLSFYTPGVVYSYNYTDTVHEYLRKAHVGRGYTVCELHAKWLEE